MIENSKKPFLGFGLGLRTDHYQSILESKPDIDWLEILTENYMVPGGKPLYFLDKIRELYPMVMHGVSMSIGSQDPLDMEYLGKLKDLIKRVQPKWVSDHLCWTGAHGKNMHDLLPMPYTEEAITHLVSRIQKVQEYLGQQILIENVSSYVTYQQSEMSEWEFITEVTNRADCLLLLDVNNIYVSAFNHHFDPEEYINNVPADRVYQIHMAGHLNCGDYIVDTHDHPVIDPVFDLYEKTIEKIGPVSTMIERDDNIPPLGELLDELARVREIHGSVLEKEAKAV